LSVGGKREDFVGKRIAVIVVAHEGKIDGGVLEVLRNEVNDGDQLGFAGVDPATHGAGAVHEEADVDGVGDGDGSEA